MSVAGGGALVAVKIRSYGGEERGTPPLMDKSPA